MSVLWRFCCSVCRKDSRRKKTFLVLNTILFALIGFAVWLILRNWVLRTWDWAVVLAGFPGYFFGLLGGAIYLYNV